MAGSVNLRPEHGIIAMTELIDHYVDQHTAASAGLAGQEIEWLKQQRSASIEAFRRDGFPSQRDEDWRYTSLKPVTSKFLEVKVDAKVCAIDLAPHLIDGLDSHRLVFIDGVFQQEYSAIGETSGQTVIGSLANLIGNDTPAVQQAMANIELGKNNALAALNLAFSNDGYIIHVADKVKLDKPIELLFISVGDNLAVQPRNSIHLGKHAEAVVIERHVSAENVASMVNSTGHITLQDGAKLDYYLTQNQDKKAWQVSTIEADLGRDSWFFSRTITLGGSLVRNNLKVNLNQPGAHCDMLGLYNITGKQHVDNHTTMIHAAEHCTSRELYKGVLDQRSRAVFHGRIKVEPDAQKTDATQANNNLLLSAHAEIDTKPQLEIYADDVKCAHGATVGQIDETALFYLRARGIGEHEARLLLTYAFLNDVLTEVSIDPLRVLLESELADKFFTQDLLPE